MSPETLAGIVARDAQSIVWAPGTLASDPAVNDKLWQAVQDRRALLVLLRETRATIGRFMVAAYRSETVGAEWVAEFDKRYTELQDSMGDLAALGEP